MPQKNTFDAIVVGGGIIGLTTAWRFAKSGQRTLLLEQFHIGHARGSSHGKSRVFSEIHGNLQDIQRARRSRILWRELERETGGNLLYMTGGIDIGVDNNSKENIMATASTLRSRGYSFEIIDGAELHRRYPQWFCPKNVRVLISPNTGILRADWCVNAAACVAKKYGALIKEQTRVISITLNHSKTVDVEVSSGATYQAKHLIIAVGPWAPDFLKRVGINLPLQVAQVQIVYFKPKNRHKLFMPKSFPVWAWEDARYVYGFPIFENNGIKISFHSDVCGLDTLEDYDHMPRADITARLESFLNEHLPDAAGKAFAAKTCLYTMTPDEEFIIDTIPGIPYSAYFTGCSGHAFHCVPALAETLVNLARNGKSAVNLSRFSPNRFK